MQQLGRQLVLEGLLLVHWILKEPVLPLKTGHMMTVQVVVEAPFFSSQEQVASLEHGVPLDVLSLVRKFSLERLVKGKGIFLVLLYPWFQNVRENTDEINQFSKTE